MKNLVILLILVSLFHVSQAQNTPVKASTSSKGTSVVTTAVTKPYKPSKLIWRTPALQEALMYYTTLDFNKAYSKLQEAVTLGDNDAYYFIGRMHQYRELKYDSIQIDTLNQIQDSDAYFAAERDSARFYYKKAIEENSLLGHLGMAELMTLRTKEDKQRFLQHMRTAAIRIRESAVEGDAFSNRILGSMYYTGFGEMKDLGYAHHYITRAAEENDVKSYVFLANMYLDGEGVKTNKEKALYWLKKGADAGEQEALYTLGLLYEEGEIGEPNPEKARQLYRKAISKGSVVAYDQLSYMNETPDQKLVIATITRNPDMLKRALNNKADVNTLAVPSDLEEDLRGRTPLMHTVYIPRMLGDYFEGYVPDVRVNMVSQLLRKGAQVNDRDIDGMTALHYLLVGARVNTELFEVEQVHLVDSLLKFGADPNLRDVDGNTVLVSALQSTNGQHIGIMELNRLVAAGANPNIQNNKGKTPLMLACEINSNFEIIMTLLQAGADPKLRDEAGKTAIDYTNRENVINILLASGSPSKNE
jgi:uncharacterized protein